MMPRRALLAIALVVPALFAGTAAYVTPHSKTYHARRDCMSLSRTTKVYTTTAEEAAKHGLKPCGICNRPPSKKSTKPDNGTWAKEAK